jgi:hypothetical protein
MTWQTHITTDPEVLAGKPVVRGTRLAVADENVPLPSVDALRAAGDDVISVSRESLGANDSFIAGSSARVGGFTRDSTSSRSCHRWRSARRS